MLGEDRTVHPWKGYAGVGREQLRQLFCIALYLDCAVVLGCSLTPQRYLWIGRERKRILMREEP